MIAFSFELPPEGKSWGECYEVVILASNEAEAWSMLKAHRAPFSVDGFSIIDQKAAAPGVIFNTAYTLGV